MAAERLTKFFEFSFLENNRINGSCKCCKNNYKDKNGIYSSSIKHLKRIHPREYNQVFASESKSITEEVNVNIDDRATADLKNIKDKQNQFIISITKNLIIKCNLPLNIVEHTGFRDFLKDCNLKCEPISAKRIKRVIIPSFKDNVLNK